MEIISRPFNGRNYWRRRGYKLLDGATTTNKRKLQVVKLRGDDSSSSPSRFWRLKKAPIKLRRLKMIFCSPKSLWNKFKDGYINMMLRLAGEVGYLTAGSAFQAKRITKARKVPIKYSNEEFESRLVMEIYRALSTSRGLSEIASSHILISTLSNELFDINSNFHNQFNAHLLKESSQDILQSHYYQVVSPLMEKDVSPSPCKHNASMSSSHSSPVESESFILSPLPAQTDAGRSDTENENKINLQSLTSLIHSLLSEEDIKTPKLSPSANISSPRSTISANTTAINNNAIDTENRLYQARLTIESHLYQELLNRYGLALNRLHDLTRLAHSLRQENDLLRLANDDLTRRFSSFLSQTQLSLPHNRASSSTPHFLIDDLQRISIAREKNTLHENIFAEDVFSNADSPTSVIESDCLERGSSLDRTFLPKSISIRSSGYLKMTQPVASSDNAGTSRTSTLSHTPPNQLLDAAKVYVKEENAVEMEVYNQGMYKTELCNKWQETGVCPYGQECQFAHGLSELRPVIRHPRYKTEVCRMVLAGISCPYGHRCHFRHSLSQSERLMMGPR
ncbi:hypothetical protein Ancab_034810 [Ancistrocladus abbreviatus]